MDPEWFCLVNSRPRQSAFKIGDYVPKSYRKANIMACDIELAGRRVADDAFKDRACTKGFTRKQFNVRREAIRLQIGAGLISADLNIFSPPR